jgi:hypothetical protein
VHLREVGRVSTDSDEAESEIREGRLRSYAC